MKLGARIFKTGIAITLAIYICQFLNLETTTFAAIAAVFAVQPSVYRSYQTILEQIQANLIGAFIAILFVFIFGNEPIFIGVAAIIVIAICLQLKIENTILLALVTVIAIMESPDENFIYFALLRFSSIIIGVFSSFVINLFFMPPKYETKLYYKLVENTNEISQWIRVILNHTSDHNVIKHELDHMKEKMIKINNIYLLYQEERNYSKKKQNVKRRKLVLFRQMIVTTNVALDILKKVYRFEKNFHQLPDIFRQHLWDILFFSLTYHEQISFKYVGKIKSGVSFDILEELSFKKEELMNSFFYHYQEDQEKQTINEALLLMSSVIDYIEQLEHLDKLIESFQTYHREDNEVNIKDKEE